MTGLVSNLDDKVRESLREQIISGAIESGAHLSELRLSKEFSVSRTPIREALCALAADGLVEMVPHRGAFVRERNAQTVQDIQNVFASLIALATRFAAEKGGIETLMQIESTINNMNASNWDQSSALLVNMIRQASGSSLLDEMLSTCEKRMDSTNPFNGVSFDSVQSNMNMLLTAFKRQKADVAEKTMRDMLSSMMNIEDAPTIAAAQATESTSSEMASA